MKIILLAFFLSANLLSSGQDYNQKLKKIHTMEDAAAFVKENPSIDAEIKIFNSKTDSSALAKKIFAKPVANTLFFAGEAFNASSNATVDAALASGKNIAEQILKQ